MSLAAFGNELQQCSAMTFSSRLIESGDGSTQRLETSLQGARRRLVSGEAKPTHDAEAQKISPRLLNRSVLVTYRLL